MARGVLLVIAAVGVGLLLLSQLDDPKPVQVRAEGTTTTAAPAVGAKGTTTTTAAPKTARNPAQVTVLVANGSGIGGAASKVSTTLGAANYLTAKPTDTTTSASVSAVYYTAGYELDARAVAALVKPGMRVAAMPTPLPVADLAGAHVLVVLAADVAKA
jgi:hypothetical protein